MIPSDAQPDQRAEAWVDHVSVYEAVFEPLSLQFAEYAIQALGLVEGDRVLDVGAGAGGASLAAAARGARVTAIDASPGMCARMEARSAGIQGRIEAHVMDGQALALADASFDAAFSVFGVVLFPDAVRGLAEMRRVVKRGGRVAVVTWTEPQDYELAAALRRAATAVLPAFVPGPRPAQLRYSERADFARLFTEAGFTDVAFETHRADLRAPSARWLADRIAFAPGMAAQLASFGVERERIVERFVTDLEAAHGSGEVVLGAKAFVGVAAVG